MAKSISKTEEYIKEEQKVLNFLLKECFKSEDFVDLHTDFNIPLFQGLLNDFESTILSTQLDEILNGFSRLDIWKSTALTELVKRLLLPESILDTIRNIALDNKWPVELEKDSIQFVFTLIKYICTLTLRFLLRYTDMSNNILLTDMVLTNIDTWLLGNLNLRQNASIMEITEAFAIDDLFSNQLNVIGYDKNIANLKFRYENILAISGEIQNYINFSIGNDSFSLEKYPESEKITDILSTLIIDFTSIIFYKARHAGHNIGICSYCNSIHFGKITVNDKYYLHHRYCNECFIEKYHKNKLSNIYWNIAGVQRHIIVDIGNDLNYELNIASKKKT